MQQAFQQFIPVMYQRKAWVVVFLAAIWAKISVIGVCTELEIAVCTSMLLILFSAHAVQLILLPADFPILDIN